MTTIHEELLDATGAFGTALSETCAATPAITEDAEAIRRQCRQGIPLAKLPTRPGRVVGRVADLLDHLNQATTRLRRAYVQALRAEGMSTARIAGMLGVTRQRVSAIARDGRRDQES